jgi:hypothetical protein
LPLKLAKALAFAAALQILGGHWMLLQSMAWVGMVIDFARTEPLPVAVAKTFDGGHPCDLCKSVSKGRGEEQQREELKLVVKFEAVLTCDCTLPDRTVAAMSYSEVSRSVPWRAHSPPTPPPLV